MVIVDQQELEVAQRLATVRLTHVRRARERSPKLVPALQHGLDDLLDRIADHYRQTSERTR